MKVREAARRSLALLRALSAAPARSDVPRPWLPRSRFLRDVLLHLVVGALVLAALHLTPEWRWLATKEDQALDWIVAMHAGVSPGDFRGVPQVFIDGQRIGGSDDLETWLSSRQEAQARTAA